MNIGDASSFGAEIAPNCGHGISELCGGKAVSEEQVSGPPIISDLGADEDFVELVEMFVSELPDRIESMRKAIEENDMDSLKRFAHQLKGAAGGYGFPTITDNARELEQSSEAAADMTTICQQVDELANMCQRARAK